MFLSVRVVMAPPVNRNGTIMQHRFGSTRLDTHEVVETMTDLAPSPCHHGSDVTPPARTMAPRAQLRRAADAVPLARGADARPRPAHRDLQPAPRDRDGSRRPGTGVARRRRD